MKIRKSTIVWFALAALTVASLFFGMDDGDKLTWTDAVYVKDAKVLPENEGKLVAVSGHPEMLAAAVDENVGVSFPSPSVHRTVAMLKYDSMFGDWKVKYLHEGDSEDGFEGGILYGRAAVGEFELDKELIKRSGFGGTDVKKDDFIAEDIAHMEDTGSLIKSGGMFCYTECKDMSSGEIWDSPEAHDRYTYAWHKDWDGCRSVFWSMWEIDPEDEVTVVGIQKGNSLTYCDELSGGVAKDRRISEDELKSESSNPVLVKVLGCVMALLFVFLGVRSMRKRKTEV